MAVVGAIIIDTASVLVSKRICYVQSAKILRIACCRCCGTVDCDGQGAEGALTTGLEGPSLTSLVVVRGAAGNRGCSAG